MPSPYTPEALLGCNVDQLKGPVVIDFGTNWCGFCQRAQPLIDAAFETHPGMPHLKIEDGSGRLLGRSFAVKLWPTLIFLKDGVELARLVRPSQTDAIRQALALIASPA